MRALFLAYVLSAIAVWTPNSAFSQDGRLGAGKGAGAEGGDDFFAKKKAKMTKMKEKKGASETASSQAENDGDMGDAAASWNKALVYLPGNARVQGSRMDSPEVSEAFATLAGSAPIPAVVYLHGCTGIGPGDQKEDAAFLGSLGLMVIMPDSFARKRPISCYRSGSGGRNDYFPGVVGFRKDEVLYAVRQLNALSFIHRSNRILMGHSEGAVVVLQYPLPQFAAYVASGVQCLSGKNERAPMVPKGKPLLVYRASGDAQAARGSSDDNCAETIAAHPEGSRSMILPGSSHWNGDNPGVRAAIKVLIDKYFVR